MSDSGWRRGAYITVTLTGVFLSVYAIGRFAIGLFLPFLFAFLLALFTRPVVLWLSRRTRCPQRVLAVMVTLAALLLLFGLCYLAVSRILLEIKELLAFLAEDLGDPDGRIATFLAVCKNLTGRIPFLERLQHTELLQFFVGDVDEFAGAQLRALFARVSERLTAMAAGLLSSAPSLLIFFLVTLISCFYFAVEYDAVCRALGRLVPQRFAERLPDLRRRAGRGARRYLRAYFILFLLTFAELLTGLLILGVEYAFLLALITALLDILPVLGVGTVLVPYAVISFMGGNAFLGLGSLILYGVITLVRQIVEPHLVGKSLGLHPILMLVAFYVGWRLFGVIGVFFGPAVAMAAKAFLSRDEGQEEAA